MEDTQEEPEVSDAVQNDEVQDTEEEEDGQPEKEETVAEQEGNEVGAADEVSVEERLSADLRAEAKEVIQGYELEDEAFEGEGPFYPAAYYEQTPEPESYEETATSEIPCGEHGPVDEGEFEEDYGEGFQFHYQGGEEEGYIPEEKEVEAESEEEAEGESSQSSLSQVYSKLSPYFIKWSFGVKMSTKIINLTKDNQFEVFYSSCHFGIIYDYRRNSMRFLPGHNSMISSISADASGRWLVTADAGEDNVIIVWDHDRMVPCWCLYNIFPGEGVQCVQISHDARFLAAVSNGPNQRCKFFLWTRGREEADGEVEIDPADGVALSVNFNHLDTKDFAITTEKALIFCRWNPQDKVIETFTTRAQSRKARIGTFRQSLYLDDNHRAITSTNLGQVVIWCTSACIQDDYTENIGSIEKKYLKAIRIHKSAISSLLLADQVVIFSSEDGMISFHDQSMSLLYWVPRYVFEPVVAVSCNLMQQQGDQLDPFSSEFDDLLSSMRSTNSDDIQDLVPDELWGEHGEDSVTGISEEGQETEREIAENIEFAEDTKTEDHRHVPSDCTIEMRPFYMRDFVFLTTNGQFGYVSHYRTKVRYFLQCCEAPITSMDCSPIRPHLALGNVTGRIDVYDHKYKTKVISNVIGNCPISNLKFCPSGRFLMAGLKTGTILVLNPLLLNIMYALHKGHCEIVKMCFSSTGKYFAFFDTENIVFLFKKGRYKWSFMGGYKSHFKEVRDIMFDEQCQDDEEKCKIPRLFTIGDDRMLVEYNTKDMQPGYLKLKSIDRIEQTAIPRCFAVLPKFSNTVYFLISNNEYKFKVLERNSRICAKTTVGPTADTPINFMQIIPPKDLLRKRAKMIYTTEKHIGLRLLPATGNPYEGIGMVGHPVKIESIAVSHDFKYIFTVGTNDRSVLMWKINSKSVDIAHQLGGTGIEPFMPLVEGGATGFLFKEIEDFFYYSQIIHQGEHANLDRSVSKNLALCEIPDLVRSLGYYPTEYEIANMMYEIKHADFEETGEIRSEVSFEECVKLYLNHKPVHGISLDSVNKALLTIADLRDPECIIVEKEELYKALESRAEAMSHAEVVGYLCILLLPKDEKNPVPGTMSLKEFADDVLGIDFSITEEHVREVTHPSENKNTNNATIT